MMSLVLLVFLGKEDLKQMEVIKVTFYSNLFLQVDKDTLNQGMGFGSAETSNKTFSLFMKELNKIKMFRFLSFLFSFF